MSPDTARRQRSDAQRNVVALVEAARTVFASSGVDAPAKDITDLAGVGVGTLYRHFPTRAKLLEAVYDQRIAELCAAAELARPAAPARALHEWLRAVVRPRSDDPRGIVILSHHQYVSRFDHCYPRPGQQLAEFFSRPVLWLWGHEHRLAIFRLLVERGPVGLPAGRIAERVGLVPSSLTFHLQNLQRAGLITQRRESRQLFYSVDFSVMNGLVGYLTENCCGQGVSCAPNCNPSDTFAKGESDEALSRARQR